MDGRGPLSGSLTPTGHVMKMVRCAWLIFQMCLDYIGNHQFLLAVFSCPFFPGWEYCAEPDVTPWQAFEKNFHRYRRRRWVRTRLRVMDSAVIERKMVSQVSFH